MLRPYSFDFGDRRHIAFNCFCAMTGPAEDLHVICCVGATECEGDDVVDVPAFAGWYGECAGRTAAFVSQEEVQTGAG